MQSSRGLQPVGFKTLVVQIEIVIIVLKLAAVQRGGDILGQALLPDGHVR